MCPLIGGHGDTLTGGMNSTPFDGRSVDRLSSGNLAEYISKHPERFGQTNTQQQFGDEFMAYELLFSETESAFTAPAFHADTIVD